MSQTYLKPLEVISKMFHLFIFVQKLASISEHALASAPLYVYKNQTWL